MMIRIQKKICKTGILKFLNHEGNLYRFHQLNKHGLGTNDPEAASTCSAASCKRRLLIVTSGQTKQPESTWRKHTITISIVNYELVHMNLQMNKLELEKFKQLSKFTQLLSDGAKV